MRSNYKSCIVLGTSARSLGSFRGDLIKSLSNKGLYVILSSSKTDFSDLDVFNHLENIEYRAIHLERNGLNFYDDIKTLFNIFSLTTRVNPRFVLAYGIKLVIWGGVSARAAHVPFFALITGLGFAFQGDSFKRRFLTKLVTFLYKIALKNSKAVIFQNTDNRDIFTSKGIVELSKTYVVNGSGVDLEKYNVENLPRGGIKFLCLSRLLGEKGLREYAEAAKIVKNKFPDVEFNLIGPEDSSPDAILLNEVDTWSDYINYKGSTDDVRPYIKDSHVYVLPSYHEGLPRSILEAMSMGRPVLTTNAVGCKETVEEGINGFKVPVKSSEALAKKMIWFIENSDQIEKMGIESRKIAEDKFDVHKVNEEMLKIMEIA
jgi:glycosyltransferase involved in cell wall biosynthesis